MKDSIYLFVLLTFFGWGCADKKEIEPDLPKYEVAFSISSEADLPAKIADSRNRHSLSASAVFDQVQTVVLFVYDSKGYLVGEYSISSPSDAFHTVSDMQEGTYTAVVVGHNGISMGGAARLATASIYNVYLHQIFVDKADFRVGPLESGKVNLVLKRKVGMLDLDITDEPTNEASYLRVTIEAMTSGFSVNTMLPVGNTEPVSYVYYPRGTYYNQLPAHFFVPGNSTSFSTSVLLEVVSEYGEILKSQLIPNVRFGVNKKTTIRGKLYDSIPQQFSVAFDEEWSDEDVIDF